MHLIICNFPQPFSSWPYLSEDILSSKNNISFHTAGYVYFSLTKISNSYIFNYRLSNIIYPSIYVLNEHCIFSAS